MKHLLLIALTVLATAQSCVLKPTTRHDNFAAQAQLPQEEAPHLRNSLEWWYFTGHLKDQATGETFGVEYVFFHFNVNGRADRQMVNFALTDPQRQAFHYDYKVEKLPALLQPTLPLALSMAKKGQTWTMRGQEGRYELQARMAEHPGYAISLRTEPAKPVLLHGGTGYENYGGLATAGYYSYPRLTATGTIEIDGKTRQVTGELWYDRQWNCIDVLNKGTGWDWFSIQLDEPRAEIMAYSLYAKQDGRSIRGGSYFGSQGENTHLAADDFQLETLATWTSPRTKRIYPAKWRLRIPSQGYDLIIEPQVPQQELVLKLLPGVRLPYWEGMCRVTGTRHGQPVTGNSYVELTKGK